MFYRSFWEHIDDSKVQVLVRFNTEHVKINKKIAISPFLVVFAAHCICAFFRRIFGIFSNKMAKNRIEMCFVTISFLGKIKKNDPQMKFNKLP